MCKLKSKGGKRCPCAQTTKAAVSANRNRKNGRYARKAAAAYAKEHFGDKTAQAILDAPPSTLGAVMAELGIPEDAIKPYTVPGGHLKNVTANDEALEAIKAAHAADVAAAAPPPVLTKDEKVAVRKLELLHDAENAEDRDTPKGKARITRARNAAEKAILTAGWNNREAMTDEQRLAFYGHLSEDNIKTLLKDAQKSEEAKLVTTHLDPLAYPRFRERDTSIYQKATLTIAAGEGTEDREGRKLDGGLAICRNGYGDFTVLQEQDGVYYPIASASGKAQALAIANKLPVAEPLAPLQHENPSEAEREFYSIAQKNQLKLMEDAAAGKHGMQAHSVDELRAKMNEQAIADHTGGKAQAQVVESLVTGPMLADIREGQREFVKYERIRKATLAGEQARAAVLSSGGTADEAQKAFDTAYRFASGKPTLKGGVIPDFGHKIPPETLGEARYKSLARSGIRAYGAETAHDFSIIDSRSVEDWGFSRTTHKVSTPTPAINSSHVKFLAKLPTAERGAITTYTGGSYQTINAAVTGREPNPSKSTKTVVSNLTGAFEKFDQTTVNDTPLRLVRGGRIPSGWKGTTEEYLKAAFTKGSRVQIGKVLSTTTTPGVAEGFTSPPPIHMVFLTRHALSVKSVSLHASEAEFIIPPGHDMRCVGYEMKGPTGKPTVYLVAEDLVAEAQDAAVPISHLKAA